MKENNKYDNKVKEDEKMGSNQNGEICPKHRIVMKNGVCRMCQKEMYDTYFRKYGKKTVEETEGKDDNNVSSSTTSSMNGNHNKFKPYGKKRNDSNESRPITENDLKRLVDKFNRK